MTSRTIIRLIFTAAALLWIGAFAIGGWLAVEALLATSVWFTLVAVGGRLFRWATSRR